MSAHAAASNAAQARIALEQKLLGWLLYDADGTRELAGECREAALGFDPLHARILATILRAREMGTDYGTAGIALAMKGDAGLNDIGGIDYLRNMAGAAPAVANARDGARQFKAALHTYQQEIARDNLAAHTADALAALTGGAPDALEALAAVGREAREVEEITRLRPPLSVSAGDFLARSIPPRRMLLAPWLPSSGLAMVHAWRGVGKTHFAIGVAIACATGGDFLRWHPESACRVLYIDGEMSAGDMQDRIRATLGASPLPDDNLRLITPDLLPDKAPVPNLATP